MIPISAVPAAIRVRLFGRPRCELGPIKRAAIIALIAAKVDQKRSLVWRGKIVNRKLAKKLETVNIA